VIHKRIVEDGEADQDDEFSEANENGARDAQHAAAIGRALFTEDDDTTERLQKDKPLFRDRPETISLTCMLRTGEIGSKQPTVDG
jgi:predicted oxidoreductase (fatty acid repression mutant protein)